MNPALTAALPLLIMITVILYERHQQIMRIHVLLQRQKRNHQHRSEKKQTMFELAKRFIDKECIIHTFNSSQIIGTVKEVTEGAILLEDKIGNQEVINLDCITRLREYPKNKKGKKKAIA